MALIKECRGEDAILEQLKTEADPPTGGELAEGIYRNKRKSLWHL